MKPNLYICHTAYQVLVDLLRAGRAPGGQRRGEGEQGDRPDEQPVAAEAVAERRGRQDECGVCERVGVDEPLELGDRGAQVAVNDR